MFKVAVFSDIHGNLEALNAILSSIKGEEYDEVICLGDVIGLGPSSKECLQTIMENKIKLVLGNHERYYLNGTHNETKMSDEEKQHHAWVSEQLDEKFKDYLSKLSIEVNVVVDDKKIGFMHYPFDKITDSFYTPKDLTEENVKRLFRNYTNQFNFFGHSHKEQFFKDNNGFIYVNLGSSGCTKDNITSYTVLDYDGENYNIYKKKCIYDRETFNQKLKAINFPNKEYIIKTFFEE
jgi:predicted phosphodiesterase